MGVKMLLEISPKYKVYIYSHSVLCISILCLTISLIFHSTEREVIKIFINVIKEKRNKDDLS